MTPKHIEEQEDLVAWLDFHLDWAWYEWSGEWPWWMRDENKFYNLTNPGLTYRRIEIRLNREKDKLEAMKEMWDKLTTE